MQNNELQLSKEQKIRALKGPIMVVGASGFIGANLLQEILAVRSDCYGITHDTQSQWRLNAMAIPAQNIVNCNILIPSAVQALFQTVQPQTVFNLAAYGAYPHQDEFDKIFETNVQGTQHLLQAAGPDVVFIHAGSNSEYGTNSNAPDEKAALQPNSYYAVSKVAASFLLQHYGKQLQHPCINLRLYSVYGPYEEPTRLLPRLVENILKKQLPPLAQPTISRDFIYITDVTLAFIHAALFITPERYGESYNIGTGVQTSLSELLSQALQAEGLTLTQQERSAAAMQPQWSTMDNRNWDLHQWVSNPQRALRELHWQAQVSLKEGIEKTLQWQKSIDYERLIAAAQKPKQAAKISVVIACYKDNLAIPVMYERLVKTFSNMHARYEIIFVNDGSPDDTFSVLQAICAKDHDVIAITHTRNFGSQAAFVSGMELATGDCTVLMDGDLQDPPELIPAFFEKWQQGYEVVYGSRVKREAPIMMNAAYRLFYRLFRKLSYINIPLDAGDFSMMDKKVVQTLVHLPEKDMFLRGLRAWVGFSQIGVPYTRPERMFGTTTNSWRRNWGWAKKAIFSFSYLPLEWLSYGGLTLTILSFIAMVAQIIARLYNPNLPHGIPTIIVLILFFGGLQLLAVSILGEYLGKVLEETKSRPKFIRKSVISKSKIQEGAPYKASL